jgi:aromatic ring-cleaving dioxygenase
MGLEWAKSSHIYQPDEGVHYDAPPTPARLSQRVAVPSLHLDLPCVDLKMLYKWSGQTGASVVSTDSEPYHAHIYYEPSRRDLAVTARALLCDFMASRKIPQLLFVGQLKDGKAGPHPIPQFEVHFTKEALPAISDFIEASGFRALVHPLTDDDLADHTRLAHWIGTPLELDLTTLDPPGKNQGVARFGKTDF